MSTARFATDTSLELLARRLRLLGHDVQSYRGVTIEELFRIAADEQRIVITLSSRRPRPFAAVSAIRVPREDPAAGVREIAAAHEPAGMPFSRCALCNTALERHHPLEARGEIPGRVLHVIRTALYCPGCGKWYWRGSHVDRMSAWLSGVLGREIGWPHDPPLPPG